MNLPDAYPIAERRIGFEWSAPWRYKRLWEVLDSQPDHALTDSSELQRDYESVLARNIINRLPEPDRVDSPLAWLKRWDAVLSAQSPQAAFYNVWYHRQKSFWNAVAVVLCNTESHREIHF